MALPAIAAAAARLKKLKPALSKIKGALPERKEEGVEFGSPEAIVMLFVAWMFDSGNIILGFLDFAFGIGVILSPIVNTPATIIIGGWLFLRGGKMPIKKMALKALGPLLGNSVPLAKFVPWWFISVWTSLKK